MPKYEKPKDDCLTKEISIHFMYAIVLGTKKGFRQTVALCSVLKKKKKRNGWELWVITFMVQPIFLNVGKIIFPFNFILVLYFPLYW